MDNILGYKSINFKRQIRIWSTRKEQKEGLLSVYIRPKKHEKKVDLNRNRFKIGL